MPLAMQGVPSSLYELRLSGRVPGVAGQRYGASTAGHAGKVGQILLLLLLWFKALARNSRS